MKNINASQKASARILVVEDESIIALNLQEVLESLNIPRTANATYQH